MLSIYVVLWCKEIGGNPWTHSNFFESKSIKFERWKNYQNGEIMIQWFDNMTFFSVFWWFLCMNSKSLSWFFIESLFIKAIKFIKRKGQKPTWNLLVILIEEIPRIECLLFCETVKHPESWKTPLEVRILFALRRRVLKNL